jgi:hypothetical protein
VLLEPVEARLPLALLLGEPATQLPHALDVQPARTSLTLDPLVDKPATSKDADVAGDGLLRQVERLGKLSDSRLPLRQSHDHCPTSRVAERREGSVEVASAGHRASLSTTFSLCNQAVVYYADGASMISGRQRRLNAWRRVTDRRGVGHA